MKCLFIVLLIGGIATKAQNTKMHVVMTGGKNAGTYDVSSVETTCSCNIVEGIAFGNQYSAKDGPPVTSLQLIVPDRKKAINSTVAKISGTTKEGGKNGSEVRMF